MNDLIKFLKFKKNVLLGQLIGEVVAITIGEIVLAIVLLIGRDSEDYFQVGTMMGLIAVLMITMLSAVFSSNDFNLLMSMCFTRRKFFVLNLLYNIITAVATVGVAFISLPITESIHKIIYGWLDFSMGDDISGFFFSGYIILFLAGVIALCQIVTVIMLKFQNKGYAVMWGLMMFVCIVVPRVIETFAEKEGSSVREILLNAGEILSMYNGFVSAAIGILFAIIVIAVSRILMAKQQVTL